MKKFKVSFVDGDYKEVECDRWSMDSEYLKMIIDIDGNTTDIVLIVVKGFVKYVEELREETDTERARKLIEKAKRSQGGFVPDWEDSTQYKYRLGFDMNGVWAGSNSLLNTAPTFGYWGDQSVCEQFIQDNYDELLWFFTEYKR